MKSPAILITTFIISLHGLCQITVKNPNPEVFLERRLIVYYGIDNPITITTGNDPTAKITVKNGTLTHTSTKGKYLLYPAESGDGSYGITITVKTSTQEREFKFDVVGLPYPEIEFLGSRNEDNAFDNFRMNSKGVFSYIKYFEVPAHFRVDSFVVTIHHPEDSANIFHHTNTSTTWDSITKKKIWSAKGGSFVTIKKVWITGPDGRQFIQKADLVGYIRE